MTAPHQISEVRRRCRPWLFALAVLTALGAASPVPAAPDPARLLVTAEEAYRLGDYAKATQQFEQLAALAPHDPAVLYNLGTAYARSGQRGLAIWRMLQALRLDPRNAWIRENLSLLAPDLEQNLAISPIPPVNWLYGRMTANEWAALAGGATVLALLAGALCFWLPRAGRGRLPLRRVAVILGLLALTAWPFAALHHWRDQGWQGVTVSEKTIARIGPSENQMENFNLPVGTVVRVERAGSTPGWLKVTIAGGSVGFVPKDQIRYL